MARAVIDFETRSRADLRAVGAHRYAEDPSTRVLFMTYSIDGGPTYDWFPGQPPPADLVAAIAGGCELEAHGAAFERAIWAHHMSAWPTPDFRQWRDTLAVCAYRSLPLGLDSVADVLDLEHKKDPRGKFLINKLCKPQKITKKNTAEWSDDFELMMEFFSYGHGDTASENELSLHLGPLPAPELEVWRLDQRINDRGIQVDLAGVDAALDIVRQVEGTKLVRLQELTGGQVKKVGEIAKMLAWVADRGYELPNLQKGTITRWLEDPELDGPVREVLEIRQSLGRASVKKLVGMRDGVCSDGRIRGLLQYHGAGTGRWAGRRVQPHNFPRGELKRMVNGKKVPLDPDELIADIMTRDPVWLDIKYGDAMTAVSDALRSLFVAGPDRTLCAGDYSAIEARVLFVLAGEVEGTRVFAEGGDIYIVQASSIFGRPITKADDPAERNVGKTIILGCGYQMGPPRFQEYAADADIILSIEECEEYVYGYRNMYPRVPEFWRGLECAAIRAVQTPGVPFEFRGIEYRVIDGSLSCRLPSGRRLWYHAPELHEEPHPWRDNEFVLKLTYGTVWQKRWVRASTYGGKLAENVVQAVARDLMVHGMFEAEREGYPIILTVHDEIVAEPLLERGPGRDEFEEIISRTPRWAEGYPLAAEAWVGYRYRKG